MDDSATMSSVPAAVNVMLWRRCYIVQYCQWLRCPHGQKGTQKRREKCQEQEWQKRACNVEISILLQLFFTESTEWTLMILPQLTLFTEWTGLA